LLSGLMSGCSDRHFPFATTVPVMFNCRNLKAKSKSDWRIKPKRPTPAGGKKREANKKLSQNRESQKIQYPLIYNQPKSYARLKNENAFLKIETTTQGYTA
jgi:hypothetical protein